MDGQKAGKNIVSQQLEYVCRVCMSVGAQALCKQTGLVSQKTCVSAVVSSVRYHIVAVGTCNEVNAAIKAQTDRNLSQTVSCALPAAHREPLN